MSQAAGYPTTPLLNRKVWWLAVNVRKPHACSMGTKSRESIYGASVRASAERAAEARKKANQLACEGWNSVRRGTGCQSLRM